MFILILEPLLLYYEPDILLKDFLSSLFFNGSVSYFRLVCALDDLNELLLISTGSDIPNDSSSGTFLFEFLFSATLLYRLLNVLFVSRGFLSILDAVIVFSLLSSFLLFRFYANIMDLADLVPLAPLTRLI